MNANRLAPTTRSATAVLLALPFLALTAAHADERRPQTRNTTRTNINSVNRTNVNVNTVNRTTVNVNTVNVNTVNRTNVNVHVHGGYYYNTGPSVGAVVATTIVVGAIVASLPPNCTTIIVNGLAYQNCGGTYYQPRYSGSTVTYVVVTRP